MVALNAQRDELREEKSGAARDSEHNLRLMYTEVQYYKLKQEWIVYLAPIMYNYFMSRANFAINKVGV